MASSTSWALPFGKWWEMEPRGAPLCSITSPKLVPVRPFSRKSRAALTIIFSRLVTMTDSIVRTGVQAERLRDQLVRAAPGLVVVRDRHDHDLLGAVLLGHLLDRGAHLRRVADHGAAAPAAGAGGRRAVLLEESRRLLRGRHRDEPALPQQRHRHPARRREPLCLLGGVGGDRPDGHGQPRLVEALATREAVAIHLRDRGA